MTRARALLLPLLALALAGCETLSYYAQAIGGHLDLTGRARPVSELLEDAETPPSLRERLALSQSLREFASRDLGLPDNGSYRRYADLNRAYAVWNVVVTPEFSLEAAQSCFPVAGCVSYRGFFARQDAEGHAARAHARGLDAFVYGVPAYSTLGAFDDPLLSTFIRWPDTELARLVFHELAHQLVYVKGDSTFNESFAVTVEREGVRRWFAAAGRSAELARYREAREREREFGRLLDETRARLEVLYRLLIPPEQMRTRKREEFERLAAEPVFLRHAAAFASAPNNALLASFATYSALVPAFERLLAECGGDLDAFYARVKALAQLDKAERARRLRAQESGMSTTLR
jgi:predicted aminopeptidase